MTTAAARRTRKQIESKTDGQELATSVPLWDIKNELANIKSGVRRYGERVGEILTHIENEERYLEDDCNSMSEWVRENAELFEYSWRECQKLIQQHRVSLKLGGSANSPNPLSGGSIQEIVRLAPKVAGNSGPPERDLSKLKASDVKRVVREATKIAESEGKAKPTQAIVRRAVDKELGIDRAAEAKKRIAKQEREAKERRDRVAKENELHRFLQRETDHIHSIVSQLADVPAEGWEWLGEHKPGVAERLAKACDELADFLRG